MEGRPSRPPDATPATLRGRASQDNVAPMVDADVMIVGGGIAGSATALRLARAGIDVVVIERATFPRDKPCGEGLLPHGIEALARSEERRVGKECRARWSRDQEKSTPN